MSDEFFRRMFFGVAALLSTGAIGFCSWVTMAITDRPSSEEVRKMIQSEAPYTIDRALILREMEESRGLRTAIENNTRAINRLEVVIAKQHGDCS
jgi:hypothetical protein